MLHKIQALWGSIVSFAVNINTSKIITQPLNKNKVKRFVNTFSTPILFEYPSDTARISQYLIYKTRPP